MELEDKEDYAAGQDVVAEPELVRVDKDGQFILQGDDNDDDDDEDGMYVDEVSVFNWQCIYRYLNCSDLD